MLAFFVYYVIGKGGVDSGKRKFINKLGLKIEAEAEKEEIIAYNEYMNMGHKFVSSSMSYNNYLDY